MHTEPDTPTMREFFALMHELWWPDEPIPAATRELLEHQEN